jgi:hypothetical protein
MIIQQKDRKTKKKIKEKKKQEEEFKANFIA